MSTHAADMTKIRALMTGEPENKYTEMARLVQDCPINALTLERACDVERTIQAAVRFEGRVSVDMALGLVLISHAIAFMKTSLGCANYGDAQTLKIIDLVAAQKAEDLDINEEPE